MPKALKRRLWDRIIEVAGDSQRYPQLVTRDRAIVAVMFASGLRSFELTALNVDDVDLEDGTVYVRHGKGDKERVPAVAAFGRGLLEAYLDERPECEIDEWDRYEKKQVRSRPLFVSRKGGRLDTSAIRRLFARIEAVLHDEGWREKIHPHATRHSHITETARQSARKKKTVFDVAAQAGHSDIRVTMLYFAALAEDRRELVDDL